MSLRPNSYAEAVARARARRAKKAASGRLKSKPRATMRPASTARAAQLREYSKERAIFLDSCVCAKCATLPASDVHHKRGRIGRLLCDKRFWIGLCAACHDWIHRHPSKARADGFLAPSAEWNVFPVEHTHVIA